MQSFRSYQRNAWQKAVRKLKSKHSQSFKSHSYILLTLFSQNCISIGTHPPGNRIAKSSVLTLHNLSARNNYWWSVKTSEKLKRQAREFLIFIGKKQTGKKCFDKKSKIQLTRESFASFTLSLIWSYFPLAPQCVQIYLCGRNLYNVLEDALFYLHSGYEI